MASAGLVIRKGRFGCAMHILKVLTVSHIAFSALTVLVGGRKSIRPVKNLGVVGVLVWLSACSKVQTCIWPS